MSTLAEQRCKPCEGGVAPLDAERSRALLQELDDAWRISDDGKRITREFRFPAFSRTIAFVNAVAFVATGEGHHPVVTFGYGHCVVDYTTTAIGGLSENDFVCAARIDRLARDF